MDISSFMTWFVSQVISIFTYTYTTLNSITFGGTSLLKVIIFINIIVPFLYIILTIPMGSGGIAVDKASKIGEYNRNVFMRNFHEREYKEGGDPYDLDEYMKYNKRLRR